MAGPPAAICGWAGPPQGYGPAEGCAAPGAGCCKEGCLERVECHRQEGLLVSHQDISCLLALLVKQENPQQWIVAKILLLYCSL